jgi:hypothetical protein
MHKPRVELKLIVREDIEFVNQRVAVSSISAECFGTDYFCISCNLCKVIKSILCS